MLLSYVCTMGVNSCPIRRGLMLRHIEKMINLKIVFSIIKTA